MGRVRGLLAVWEEARRRRDRILIGTCLTLGHGRAATLALLSEMVVQNARAPSPRHPQLMGRGLAGMVWQYHSLVWAGQDLEILDLTQVLLTLCSESQTHGLNAYVGAGVIYLPYQVQSLPHPDPLVLSQTWT